MRNIVIGAGAILAFAVLLTISGTGCHRKTPAHSSGGMKIAGREIKFSLDAPGGVSSRGENAVISFGKHQLEVEKERLLLDGKERVKIGAAISLVEVMLSNTTLTVMADSTNVLKAQIAK